MPLPPITLPSGVTLREPEDFDTLRELIYEGARKRMASSFPASYNGVRLELHDLDYSDPPDVDLDGFAFPFSLPFEAVLEAQPNRASIRVTAPYRVTVGATATQLTSSGNVNGGVCVKALVPGQTMYLGISSAVTTLTGWPMTDNESLCLEVRNANELYGIASAAAQSVAVLPFSRF